jgi:probable addiction module antidote protein
MRTQKQTGKSVKKVRLVDYTEGLHERLRDKQYAEEYLNAVLEGAKDPQAEFLLALRDIATAYGFASVAKKINRGRASLYKSLSKDGNPSIDVVLKFLRELGLRVRVESVDSSGPGTPTPLAAKSPNGKP